MKKRHMLMENTNYSNPLISIVTVCYNSEKTIETTLKSVLNQTYRNYEYIIVDGKSTDNTLDIIRKYEKNFSGRLKIISEKDTGIYNAMNKGIKICSGVLVGIVNSDDYYSFNTLQLVAEQYKKERYELIVINGEMERVSNTGELIKRYHFTEKDVQAKRNFGHPAMFAAKAVYDKIGLYDESYKFAADGEWQYRALDDERVRYVICHEVFSHMREGGASDNFKYRWKWFHERSRMRIQYKKGSPVSVYIKEFYKVIKCDVKNFLPKKLMRKIYKYF